MMNLYLAVSNGERVIIAARRCNSFLPVFSKNGAHYALYYISQRGFFSLHFISSFAKGSCLLVTGGSLLCYIFIFHSKRVDTHVNAGAF